MVGSHTGANGELRCNTCDLIIEMETMNLFDVDAKYTFEYGEVLSLPSNHIIEMKDSDGAYYMVEW